VQAERVALMRRERGALVEQGLVQQCHAGRGPMGPGPDVPGRFVHVCPPADRARASLPVAGCGCAKPDKHTNSPHSRAHQNRWCVAAF
jgi:hypothetical protein